MFSSEDGNAIVYCQGKFNTPWGKTAHGLVRYTKRYTIACVIDSRYAGQDSGQVLDETPNGIPVTASLEDALETSLSLNRRATHFVIGLAPDGGSMDKETREAVHLALENKLHVDSGLHHFISDEPDLAALAAENGLTIRDIRKTPGRKELHPFSGKISEVASFRVALLGTDSAVGKRTTAWLLQQALDKQGVSCEFIGTGQTAWMQGARYCIILDSLINDFVAGEIEHAILQAWDEKHPRAMVIEGQGSLMNPLYPGGFEILAAGRPHCVVLQHAPGRLEYDGMPGYPLHSINKQIEAIELLSEKKVIAVTISHEQLDLAGKPPEESQAEIDRACAAITAETGLPACDPLIHPLDTLLKAVTAAMKEIT